MNSKRLRCDNCGRFLGVTHLVILATLKTPQKDFCNWDCMAKLREKIRLIVADMIVLAK